METPDGGPQRARLNRLAWLLDSSIRLPGTDFRIGVDALLGLLPGGGDVAGVVLSSYIVLEAARMGVPGRTLVRMIVNIAVEALAGAIPIAGDLFDAAWKANQRNVALLNSWLDAGGAPVSAAPRRQPVIAVLAALLTVVIATAVLALLAAWWVWAALLTP
jgi:hypothetical protein